MGIFSRNKERDGRRKTLISATSLGRLAEVGHTAFGTGAPVDVTDFYLNSFIAAGNPIDEPAWSTFVEQFLSELSHAAHLAGGWAYPGAFYVAKDFVKSEDHAKPAFDDLMNYALVFLRDSKSDPAMIPNFALPRWHELHQG